MQETTKAASVETTPITQDKYTDNPQLSQLSESMADVENFNPIEAIINEAEAYAGHVGMLRVKTANQTINDAAARPNPANLYHGLWYEGEMCCLFADSNVGKSIFAVQMADEIARTRRVVYADFELSDKQFQLRYTDKETGVRHVFPADLYRAEIDADSYDLSAPEDAILNNIEEVALRYKAEVVVVDNLTALCNSSEKGDAAGLFMGRLMNLKRKYCWSLLIIAHTPKRQLTNPITQNDLAGSKRLYNLFDSCFSIGQSAKDKAIRYVKQLKVRADEFLYSADNVIEYEVVKDGGFLHFEFRGYACERDHLRTLEDNDIEARNDNIIDLYKSGKSMREIADIVGVGKSTVQRAVKAIDKAEKAAITVDLGIGKEDEYNGLF